MSDAVTRGSIHEALINGKRLLRLDASAALEQAEAILSIDPNQSDAAWLAVRGLEALGRRAEAMQAAERAAKASLKNDELRTAAAAINRGDLATAERCVRPYVNRSPDDVLAAIMLADIATRLGIYTEAEGLLRRASSSAPSYPDLSINLALVLFQQGRVGECLSILDDTISRAPSNMRAATCKADILAQTGEYHAAAACYRSLLDLHPGRPEIWLWYGNVLKTLGDTAGSLGAYRRAIDLDPGFAEAWWSVTELKGNHLSADDIAIMTQELQNARSQAAKVFLHFALGRCFENKECWQRSFDHFAAANRMRLALEPHDKGAVSAEVDRSVHLFDRQFFTARATAGSPSDSPIFILGMPRAGSTLVEQILASHSLIEGTSELPYIPLLVRGIVASDWKNRGAAYPQSLKRLDEAALSELGERYLNAAALHRKTKAPYFIDKFPNNWRYIGLIRTILPNAKIIDARREAMSCCFSNFKQHFTKGQTFAYSQSDLASYYCDYIRMIDHFERDFPGSIFRVQHETLLDHPEREIRKLLDFVGVPYQEQCLRPHENKRPVRTASSEQVRRPISKNALGHWRHFEPWLDDLKIGLGDVLEAAPSSPT